jgi:hypothetical protein
LRAFSVDTQYQCNWNFSGSSEVETSGCTADAGCVSYVCPSYPYPIYGDSYGIKIKNVKYTDTQYVIMCDWRGAAVLIDDDHGLPHFLLTDRPHILLPN